jgi:hypothetical protein
MRGMLVFLTCFCGNGKTRNVAWKDVLYRGLTEHLFKK